MSAHVVIPHCPLSESLCAIDIMLLKLLDREFMVDLTADVALRQYESFWAEMRRVSAWSKESFVWVPQTISNKERWRALPVTVQQLIPVNPSTQALHPALASTATCCSEPSWQQLPRQIWPIAKKKKKIGTVDEPKEENLAMKSSVAWLVAKLLSAVSKIVSLFIFIRVRALHLRCTCALGSDSVKYLQTNVSLYSCSKNN